MKGISLPKLTPWRVVGAVLVVAGAAATIYRYLYGLGAATNLSDDAPWGLWKGFNVICGVGLAAGGFTFCAIVHVFNVRRFKPLARPAVLTAFLGYLLVIAGLLIDLGKPLNIWHVIVMWNPHSVLFEVSWCIMLYTAVLALEFSPAVLERFQDARAVKAVKAITVPLVIAGVLLSTLHQSSLGSLFLIMPGKLHPFWYSPMLPVFFLLSAVAIGLGVMILESFLVARAFRRPVETPLLGELARLMVVILAVYATAKVADFRHRGLIGQVVDGSREATLLWIELVLFVVVPAICCGVPRLARRGGWLCAGAASAVLGFAVNRLNVSILGLEATVRAGYVPGLVEICITVGLVTCGIAAFALAVRYLPVFSATAEAAAALPPRAEAGRGTAPRLQPPAIRLGAGDGKAEGSRPAVPLAAAVGAALSGAALPAPVMIVEGACACGKRFRAGVQHAGKRGKCPACGGEVVVPAAPAGPVA